jgi:hypothetical protein
VAERIPLVRDVLDKQIFDREKVKVGKVDAVIVALRAHRAPRLVAIELSTVASWRRISVRLARSIEWLLRFLFGDAAEPVRIRFEHIVDYGVDVVVDVDAKRTGAFKLETMLRQRLIDRIPGGKPPKMGASK